jgi:tetratricopeptide (TPR) repeat protein
MTVADHDRGRRRRERTERRRQVDWADPLCEFLLVLVVMGSVLAIGSVHMPALLTVAALAFIGGTLAVSTFRRLPTPAIVLGALALFSVLQAVPIPATWALRLSPVSSQVWLRCLAPFGERDLVRFPISLDAGASVAEGLKWLTYAAVYLMAARVRMQRGPAWLGGLLFISAALVALITLLHGAADLRVLYGAYEPNFSVARWNVGPLLNSNNFAGYANLGLFAGAGLVLSTRQNLPRFLVFAGLGVLVTALLLSGSRAGIFSAVACGSVIVVWLTTVERARPTIQRLFLGAAPFVLGALGAVLLGTAKNWGDITSLNVRRKVAVWAWSMPMIRDHAWFGVGRGAFETSFPPYRQILDADWTAVFSHAENFALDWIAEWGMPVGLCATLLIVGYVLREWLGSKSDRLRFLALTGLVALLLQNLADLGLEIPAVAIAAVLALATGERSAARASSGQPIGARALVPTLLLGIWLAAAVWSRHPVEGERRELSDGYRELAAKDSTARREFRDELRAAMLRHPGESFFPLLGSLVAYRARDESPLPWLGRSLELSPTNGPAHLVLAQLLGAHKAILQAMLHLRLAAEYDSTLSAIAGARAIRWAPSLDVLMQAIPDGPTGDSMLASACEQEPRAELKVQCFRQATARNPRNGFLLGQLAESLLLATRSRQPPCDGASAERCVEEVDASARKMAKLDPKSWRPGYLIAKVLLAHGDAKGAANLLAKVCPADVEGRECEQEAISTAVATGSDEAIVAASDKYAARTCETSASCAETLDWIGTTLDAAGKSALAINYYSKAAEADGSAARWLHVADRATRARLFGVARLALERADRSPDATPNSRAHSKLLMQRVARALAGMSPP